MKIIYIGHVPLTKKIANHWLLHEFTAKKIECTYYDVGQLIRKNYNNVRENYSQKKSLPYEVIINSYSDFKSRIANHDPKSVIYVMLFLPELDSLGLYSYMTKFNCKMVYFSWGLFPIIKLNPMRMGIIWYLWSLFHRVYSRLKIDLLQKIGCLAPLEIVFTAGSAAVSRKIFAKKMVPVNLCDNDKFIDLVSVNDLINKEKYMLFIDSNMTHNDKTIKNNYFINPNQYFSKMNCAFQRLEKILNMPVIIAAHPYSNYLNDYFHGRRIISGKVAELIMDAELVLSHQSTANAYAILFNKPLLLIKTNEMELLNQKYNPLNIMQGVASELNINIFKAEDIANTLQFNCPYVNNNLYDEYKYKFIVSKGFENKKNIDNIYPEIIKLFNK